MTTINIPDFLAAADVLQDTIDEADRLPRDEAINVMFAIEALKKKCNEALDALKLALVSQMELNDSIVRGGFEVKCGDAGKWQYHHDAIARATAIIASRPDEDTGEIPSPHRAAAEAARMMRQIYASDSTDAKVGKLDEFGIVRDAVRDFVAAGKKKISVRPATVDRRNNE